MTEIMQIVHPTPELITQLINSKKIEVFMIQANYKAQGGLAPTIRTVEAISISQVIAYIASGKYLFFYLEDLEEESENE